MKHFSIKLFFFRDVLRDGAVCLKYYKTEDQLSYIFTKALPESRFELLTETWTCQPLIQDRVLNFNYLLICYFLLID